MGLWSRLTGGVAAVGIGGAAAAAIEPVLEPERQRAWMESQARIFDVGSLARLVAQGLVEEPAAAAEAERNGFTAARFANAVQLELRAAPVDELLELWRRRKISEALVDHGLAKAQIETEYWAALKELEFDRLGPEVVAVAVQRGVMPNAEDASIGGPLLPVGPPTEAGKIPPMPMVDLDPFLEAMASGDNPERLAVRTRIVGLPPAAGELLELLNRDEITEADYRRGIAEGNTRNEWAKALMTLRRMLLTPHEYAELRLRGWIDTDAMHAGAALRGMTEADTDLLFKVLGRPIPTHQVTTGLARGGTYDGPRDAIPEAYIRSLEQGNQRPEWYNLSFANRYSYPSAFVLRALTQAGELTEAEAHEILLYVGWEPTLAAKVSKVWSGGTGKATGKTTTKAEGQLYTAAHKAYVAHEATDADATAALERAGTDLAEVAAVLALWQAERELVTGSLSPAAIRKAVGIKIFTTEQAVALLQERHHMSAEDAATFLAEA